ncbi:hypothetical protein R3P38DRAFT_888699 [Favolaschia claudopus]|uniref:Uncharacterized protein n=1 Tax=Favolaschia claudopus TaxID=2862362 RepID=A0AAW0BXB1_9AGAR
MHERARRCPRLLVGRRGRIIAPQARCKISPSGRRRTYELGGPHEDKGKGRAIDEEEIEMEKQKKRRQWTPARVVGERVYFPGSPAPVTTTQLLEEAEREVVSRGVVSPSRGEGSTSFLVQRFGFWFGLRIRFGLCDDELTCVREGRAVARVR